MSSNPLFLELSSDVFFGAPALECGSRLGVHILLFAKPNRALGIIGSALIFATNVTNSSARCEALYGHAIASNFGAHPTFIRPVKADGKLGSLSSLSLFQSGEWTESPQDFAPSFQLNNTHETPQCCLCKVPYCPFGKDVLLPWEVGAEFSQVAKELVEVSSETTSSAGRVKKFDVNHDRHQNLLVRVEQANGLETLLRNIRIACIHFLAQPFGACGFYHASKHSLSQPPPWRTVRGRKERSPPRSR